MDNLKSLIDAKQYERLLRLTEGAQDVEALFYRISCFTALGRLEEALSCIKENNFILQTSLPVLMKVHISLLCLMTRFKEAREELAKYEELPYFSQVAEEGFIFFKKYIDKEEETFYKSKQSIDEEQIIKLLTSDKDEEVLLGIDSVRKLDANPFINYFKKIMLSYPRQSVRSFALMELVYKKLNMTVDFFSHGETIQVNPSLLKDPFSFDSYQHILSKLNNEVKDTSILDNAKNFLATYFISIFPKEPSVSEDIVLLAIINLASKYLKQNYDLNHSCEIKGVNFEECSIFYKELDSIINGF